MIMLNAVPNLNDFLTAISTVGFPIVCCAVMFWQSHENSKLHKEESDKWTDALTNNTLAIQKLTDMVERFEGKKND